MASIERCLALLVLGLTCLVAQQYVTLRLDAKRVAEMEHAIRAANDIHPGERHIRLRGYDLFSGQARSFQFADYRTDTWVFFYSHGCTHCAKTLPVWAELVDRCRLSGMHTISVDIATEGLLGDALGQLRSAQTDPAEVRLVFPDPSNIVEYRLTSVPVIVRLDTRGAVRAVWYGEVTQTRAAAILRSIS
jgi:hypothetical protein